MTNANKISILLLSICSIFIIPQKSFALTDSQVAFYNSGQANNVISNEHFLNINSMSAQDIQAFLDENNSYLKSFTENGRSAAQIIYDASHGYGEASGPAPDGCYNGICITGETGTVSPKVILVYLQKEQSLISRTTYQAWAMTASMGYNCYAGVSGDNNGNNCKDIYEGFTKQVENGAWQLRYNYERASGNGFSDYQVGQTFNTSDGFSVTIANRATASVYRYTPYVYYSAYNVWNLFYNLYDFDSGDGVVPPVTPTSENDTGAWSRTTFGSLITLSGTKTIESKAYFNDNLIASIDLTNWSLSFEAPIGNNSYAVVYRDMNGVEIARKTIQVNRKRPADSNGDGVVDSTDLSILADSWGKNVTAETVGDLNGDGAVDSTDLSILADAWGK